MYSLPYYKTGDPQKLIDFMRAHPFAMLMGVDASQRPVATQVPLLLEQTDDRLWLSGHIMRKTDHHLALNQNPNVLAVFSGAHSYVSASWYTNPQVGSTWNYLAVHARGTISWLNDEGLRHLLRKLTNHFESNEKSPARYEHLTDEYIGKLLPAIIGFKIEVTSLDHVFKLSQNRDAASYDSIVNHLTDGDDSQREIAERMRSNRDDVFPDSTG